MRWVLAGAHTDWADSARRSPENRCTPARAQIFVTLSLSSAKGTQFTYSAGDRVHERSSECHSHVTRIYCSLITPLPLYIVWRSDFQTLIHFSQDISAKWPKNFNDFLALKYDGKLCKNWLLWTQFTTFSWKLKILIFQYIWLQIVPLNLSRRDDQFDTQRDRGALERVEKYKRHSPFSSWTDPRLFTWNLLIFWITS